MTNEEALRAFTKADAIYNDMVVDAYANRDEKDHSTRMTLAKNDVRLGYPEIWDEWNRTHEELQVTKLKFDERLVEAYESMGVKAYANKLSN